MANQLAPGAHILTAAMRVTGEMIARNGAPPTLREVAEALSTSASDLEKIVPNIEMLLHRMAENAMLLLQDALVRAVAEVDLADPIEQFAAFTDAYVTWAYRYPFECRFLGSFRADDFEKNERLRSHEKAIHAVMRRLLVTAQNKGLIADDEPLDLIIATSRAFAFGISAKMLLGDLARWNQCASSIETARASMRLYIKKFLRPDAPMA